MVELVKKYKVLDDTEVFTMFSGFENGPSIEVHVEEKILSELKEKGDLLIDAYIADMKGEKKGFFFIKNVHD